MTTCDLGDHSSLPGTSADHAPSRDDVERSIWKHLSPSCSSDSKQFKATNVQLQ